MRPALQNSLCQTLGKLKGGPANTHRLGTHGPKFKCSITSKFQKDQGFVCRYGYDLHET